MRALVIEDEYIVALALAEDLRLLGYDPVETTANEQDAVAAALSTPPDLVTADFSLFRGTGVGAVNAIYAKLVPAVVFITSSPERVLVQLPDAIVLSKPYTLSELTRAVQAATLQCSAR